MTLSGVPMPEHETPSAVRAPRVAGLKPARFVQGLGSSLPEAARHLRLDPAQMRPYAGGSCQAEIACPAGLWRYWPDRGDAMWIGARSALAPLPEQTTRTRIVLSEAMRRLDRAGFHCDEMRLLGRDGWTEPLDALSGLMAIATANFFGVSGWWTDDRGASARVELFEDGTVWGESAELAERCLLISLGMAHG